ncbi:MAG: hypothetical protein FWH10_04225, partial [Oscillospiraceae bacterium]|nr:hypothetical protein [Oscillospiraceae bacterium]
TKEQTARRSWVRYEKKLGDGYFSYYGNRMNDDMYDAGYADFIYYDGVEFWVNAKYWTEESGIGHSDHCFSLQFYYSVKPMWRAYIDNHPEYVADVKKGRNDPARYTENFLEWMKAHNITPGTEQMYEELSKFINQGRDLGAISEDGESGGNIMNMFFTSSIMRYLFWGMTLISLALCMACSIVAVINSMGDSQVKRPVGQVIGTIGKTMFTFLIVPVLIMVAINLSGIILRQVNQVFDMGTTGSSQQPTSMATAIIAASLTEDSVRNVPAGEIRALELEKQKRNLLSGRITWKEPIQFIGIFDPFQMYLIPSIITAWFCLMIMIMVLMMFSRRVYELLLLYIASPFTICSMPLDGGAKFKAWREAFISKVLSGFSSVFTIKVVILMMPLIWTSGITLIDYNETYDTVLKLMIMAGGMYAAYKSHTLINNLLMLGGGGDTDKETSTFAAQNTFVKAGSAAMRTAKKIDKGVTDFAFKAAEKTVTYKSDQRKDAKDKAKKKDEESKKEKMFSDLLPVKGGTTANNKSEKELRKQSKTLDSMKKKYKKLKKLEKLKNQENMPLTDKEKKRLAKKSGKNHKYRVKKLYKDNMDNKSSQGNKDLYLK